MRDVVSSKTERELMRIKIDDGNAFWNKIEVKSGNSKVSTARALLSTAGYYLVPQPSSPSHTNVADEAASTRVDVRHGGAATTVSSLDAGHDSGNIDKTPSMPHDLPLPRGQTLGSDDGRMQHNELMDLVTKLSNIVVALKTDLQQTKKVYGAAFTKLIKKGRKIAEIDQDPDISLVQDDTKFNFDFNAAKEVSTAKEDVSTTKSVTTAGAEISTASPEVKTAGDFVDDIAAKSAAKSLVYIRRSATKTKDKEWENIQARVEADEEITARLQVEEQGELTIEERSIMFVELMDKRKKYFAAKRAEERRNKPLIQA
ncbi:hypothetical protein Tco_0550326 [Tanacetum coccineum]